MTEPQKLPKNNEKRLKLFLFFFILSVLIFISGARLVSSDEVSMFLTVESLIKNGSLAIPSSDVPNSTVIGGKSYTWYEAGNILAGIPMYLTGFAITSVLPLSPVFSSFVTKATVSLTGALTGAFIALIFYSIARRLGIGQKISVLMTMALIITTFLLPYLKMFMREPILALCLLGGTGFLILAFKNKTYSDFFIAGIFIGFGILTKLAFAINLLPIGIYFIIKSLELNRKEQFKVFIYFGLPVLILGFIGTGTYNFIRFGNPLDTGYAGGTSFNIPLYVGMFGLLLSPGKGLFWFAPLLLLIFPAIKHFKNIYRSETYLILSMFILNLMLSSVYIAWGGDGSWGPRYLAPFLPLFFLILTFYISQANKIIKQIAVLLSIAGFIIQIGGISIYAGAYLREINEYPYQKNFDDPEFLSRAHFIPNYSPIIGHWKMLVRNTAEHLDGKYPVLTIKEESSSGRIPIANEDQSQLLHTIDFWFTYASYANISKYIILFLIFLSTGISTFTGLLLFRNIR